MTCGLLPRDAAEHSADRHAEAGEIAVRENVARHHLARRVNILRRMPVRHQDASRFIDLEAQVRERDARTERICPVRWGVESLCPVRLVRAEPFGAATVECAEI